MTSPESKQPTGNRFFTFLRILNVRLRFVFLMVVVGLIVGYWEDITNRYDRWMRRSAPHTEASTQGIEYYCPMHPNIVRDGPSSCPICGMPLSRREKGDRPPLPAGVLSQIQLTPYKQQMGRITTSPVAYELLQREIRTVGIVGYDETRRSFIAARIKGRIEKLLVNYVGQRVEKGAPLAAIYSPDLLVAQEELLTAARSLRQASAGDVSADTARTLVEAARKKLLLWGITAEQIDAILKRGTPETTLTIFSPMTGIVTEKNVLEGHYVEEGADLYTIADLSRVWMEVKIFEDQIAGIEVGTAVEVMSTAYSSETFAGRIAFVAYTVDPATRTVSARVEIDNPDYRLKPGMYASAVIRLPVGKVRLLDAAAAGPATQAVASAPSLATDAFVKAYAALAESFAADKTNDQAAQDLARQAGILGQQAKGELATQAKAVATAVGLLPGKDLAAQRKLFKGVSEAAIKLVKGAPPREQPVHVAYCPMVKADWLQINKNVRNPYYGSEMLECGEITETIAAAGARADNEKFARGYYCPVNPTRLYEKPDHCPVDKFGTRLAEIEKILAVPAGAVVDTGTRQIVYRESAPGVFDMVEVKLGARAGEFFPVLSGISAGDRVATAGAFLVDAENRLNPSAAAQYFGASGGPQPGHQ